MKITATAAATLLFAGIALALPADLATHEAYNPCNGLVGDALCCTIPLTFFDINCVSPPLVPANATDFTDICGDIGKEAQCCTLPLLGNGVFCQTPVGGVGV
ncbi:Cerato-ulmin hydrophobin family [Xylariomycetidae sp. FL2044]|nr:Cerato-ulmin hydrophobin family [Xylariomycetidae sp. FL2044]